MKLHLPSFNPISNTRRKEDNKHTWLQPEQVAAGERLCTPPPITPHLLLPASRHSLCSIPNKSLLLCYCSKSILRGATRPHKEQLIINYTPMVFQLAPIHHRLLDAFNQSASLSYSHVSLLFFFFLNKGWHFYSSNLKLSSHTSS